MKRGRLTRRRSNVALCLQRRNDREEIRRRLAMGPDADDLRAERGRKPSLQSRLQSGKLAGITRESMRDGVVCTRIYLDLIIQVVYDWCIQV